MKMRTESRLVLALATSAVCLGLMQSAGWAQYQTENNSGRVLDANNRLGSDGTNPSRTSSGITPNDLVEGTVTRGRQLRAGQQTAPTEFRGNLIRPSDTLVRDAGVSVYDRGANYDPAQSSRYWGDARGVAAPTGFERVQIGSPGQFPVTPSPFRVPGDLRMDAAIPNPDLGLSRPTQYILPGISQTNGTEVVFAPPPDVPSLAQQQQAAMPLMPSSELLRRLSLNETKIKEMQEEVRRSSGTDITGSQDVTQGPETPINEVMKSDISSALQTQAVTGSLYTEQALRQRLVTAAPMEARQNTQYAELRQRLQRFRQSQAMSDQEANQQFLQDYQKAKAEEEKKQATGKETPVQRPEDVVRQEKLPGQQPPKAEEDKSSSGLAERRARVAARTQLEGQNKVEGLLPPQADVPVRISSFADGVKATGLKTLLTDAEKAMQAGKFTQALDYYDAAAAVAPDNAMVLMGRATAELGAGYYARAQMHLEQVLSADPALLMARYDLKTFYGDDRLQYIVRDLKDLSQTETRQARPLFLLAFIAYSTENDQRTADYLTLAQQRGGSKEFYDELREYWRLNPEGPKKPVLKQLTPR